MKLARQRITEPLHAADRPLGGACALPAARAMRRCLPRARRAVDAGSRRSRVQRPRQRRARPARRPTRQRRRHRPPTRSPAAGTTQSIVALVNDEPITGYEIEQRITLSLMGTPELQKRLQERLEVAEDQRSVQGLRDRQAEGQSSQVGGRAAGARQAVAGAVRGEHPRRGGQRLPPRRAPERDRRTDRRAPEAAGGQEGRRGRLEGGCRPRAQGHGRAQQDDAAGIQRVRHQDGRRLQRHARAHQGVAVVGRRDPAHVRSSDHGCDPRRRQARRHHRGPGRRQPARLAHPARGAGRPEGCGAPPERCRAPARRIPRLRDHGGARERLAGRPLRRSRRAQADNHPRADAQPVAQRPRRRDAAAHHRRSAASSCGRYAGARPSRPTTQSARLRRTICVRRSSRSSPRST